MSGRGLGHTGGTVDKLESIPGYKTTLTVDEFLHQVEQVGVAVIGQSGNLTPADKKLYALRDVTATVDSLPLITSSIMSKKLAAGSHSIVLDVKVGSGAFMKTLDAGRELAEHMVTIGKACGRNVTAVLTNMDVPLGHRIGNALEVEEAVEILRGEGCPDLQEVCTVLASNMLMLCNGWDEETARAQVKKAIASGRAFEQMKRWVAAQGGDPAVLDDTSKLPQAAIQHEILAPVRRLSFPHGRAENWRSVRPARRRPPDEGGRDRLRGGCRPEKEDRRARGGGRSPRRAAWRTGPSPSRRRRRPSLARCNGRIPHRRSSRSSSALSDKKEKHGIWQM